MRDLSELRHHIMRTPMRPESLSSNPIHQCEQWLDDAVSVGFYQANSMTLATIDVDGYPSARIVLLKQVRDTGFVFYTNYDSRKGKALAANDRVALLLYWDQLERQIRIEGQVQKLSPQDNEGYFATRPRDSQIAAWASVQSEPVESREQLLQQVDAITERFAEKPVPCPPFWGGYEVVPQSIEFWQGQAGRLHDRLLYEKDGAQWQVKQLAP